MLRGLATSIARTIVVDDVVQRFEAGPRDVLDTVSANVDGGDEEEGYPQNEVPFERVVCKSDFSLYQGMNGV